MHGVLTRTEWRNRCGLFPSANLEQQGRVNDSEKRMYKEK